MDIQKEREAFETWLFSTEKFKFRNKNFLFMLDEYGNYEDKPVLEHWETWQAAKAQAVPAKLVLELEKGRFKEYEFKALLHQSLRASKVTRSKLNWVHVMSMLGTGSTVAHRICEALGVNPDGTEFKAQEPAND